MKRSPLGTLALLPAFVLAACSSDTTVAPASPIAPSYSVSGANGTPATYVLDFSSAALPASLSADVAAAGGTLTSSMDGIGVAVAQSDDPGFSNRAARIAGVRAVTPDLLVQWIAPNERVAEMVAETDVAPDAGALAAVGSLETFRPIQWNVDAVSAPGAWNAGQQGQGARVAIIDGGIYARHIDIQPNLDVAHSRSFVPGVPFDNDVGTFWHGTHVAGIVAAPANNIGTVGVAPRATIIGVKALHNGSGSFSWVINAIYYAATPIAEGGAGANIINMSLGAGFNKNEQGVSQLKNAIAKATTYAYQRGVTVIAAAGNDAIDLDHSKNLVELPAQLPHVIAVSATGPLDFSHGATNYDRPASYTNFGQSAITLAGPGGDFVLPGNDICSYARKPSGTGLQFCWALDMVVAPCRGSSVTSISSYCWAAGTSMASPAVAGVAALIVGKNGAIPPAQVEAKLRQSADDLGKPGNDDYYGRGRVNAARAVQ